MIARVPLERPVAGKSHVWKDSSSAVRILRHWEEVVVEGWPEELGMNASG